MIEHSNVDQSRFPTQHLEAVLRQTSLWSVPPSLCKKGLARKTIVETKIVCRSSLSQDEGRSQARLLSNVTGKDLHSMSMGDSRSMERERLGTV
jgi:hypothetical protein